MEIWNLNFKNQIPDIWNLLSSKLEMRGQAENILLQPAGFLFSPGINLLFFQSVHSLTVFFFFFETRIFVSMFCFSTQFLDSRFFCS